MTITITFSNEHILLITVPTIKILLQLIQLKKLFLQTTVYKYFRLKKHLVNNNNNNLAYNIMDENILLITNYCYYYCC